MILGDGSWNFVWLNTVLPATMVDHIATHAPPTTNVSSYYTKWKWSVAGNFLTSKTYKHFLKATAVGVPCTALKVWKAGIPQHVRMFIWLLLRDCLLTNEIRAKRGMCDVPSCDLCGEVVETALHAIRDYASARPI